MSKPKKLSDYKAIPPSYRRDTFFIEASDVLTVEDMENLEMSSDITWGGANRTLVTIERLEQTLGYTPKKLKGYHPWTYIDLEN